MLKGILLVCLSATFYGCMPLITTVFYSMGFSAVSASFWRFFPIVPVLLAVCAVAKIDVRLPWRRAAAVCLRCGLPSGLTMFLLNTSSSYIDTGLTTTIHFLYPVLVVLMAFLVYHDSITRRVRWAVVAIAAGMAVIAGQTNASGGAFGVACAAASALTYAIYILQLDHGKFDQMNPFVLTLYVAATNSVLMFAIGLFTAPVQVPATLEGLAVALGIAAMSFCALTLLTAGSTRLMAQYTAVFGLLEPLASIACGVLFLREPMTAGRLVGCLLVLGAILAVAMEGRSVVSMVAALRARFSPAKQ